MKKIILIICLILPGLVNAASTNETASPFPNAKKGINLMPMAEINIPITMKNQILLTKKAFETEKFENTTSTDQAVMALFQLEKNAKDEIKQFDNDKNPYDTHLKSSPSKINLAFTFNGIPNTEDQIILGYAAAGGYVKEKGWDGIVQFISSKKFGVCSYTTYQIEKVILDKETTEYLVNKKPSNKNISGNWDTGFLYTVNWYTDNRLMTLECANKLFKPALIKDIIKLANNLDNNNAN